VAELQAEVDRGHAELARMRERLRADAEAEKEPPPVWVFPRIQPGKP
jgi:uncharacterized coiled-coil protein SlyX